MRAFTTTLVTITFLTLALLPCRADVKQSTLSSSELVPAGHWVYDAMTYLAVESGETTLASNAPASFAELRAFFGAVADDRLSAQGRNLYAKVARFLGSDASLWSSGVATLDVAPAVTLSASLPHDDAASFNFDSVSRFNGREPLVSLPVTIGFTPSVTAFADLAFGTGFWATIGANDITNVPLSSDAFDANAPARAYLSAGNAFMNFTIGRGTLSVGRTASGSMILSSSCDRLDYAQLAFFSPKLRFSLTPVELAVDRFAFFHDASFRPFPSIAITLSETATVHSALDPRYLNPLMVFHNYAGWRDDYGQAADVSPVGTQFGLSADIVPLPGVRFYGQLAVNQFQTSFELSKYGDSAETIPNSIGGLAGAEYIKGFMDGFLVVTTEGVWTNPWLYVLSNPDISYVWTRKELVAPDGHTSDAVAGWLGSPYGPGAIAAICRVLYDVPSERKLSAEYRFERMAADEANLSASSGPAGVRHGLVLSCDAFLSEKFEASASVGYSILKRGDWAGAPNGAVSVTWRPR